MKKFIVYFFSLLLFSIFFSCGKGGTPKPVPIYSDEDVCEFCRMLITDKRFAAECIMKKGRAKKFDDPICMIRYFTEGKILGHPGREAIRQCYVKDYNTLEWIPAEKAFYVKAPIITVMGYGVVAFKDNLTAVKFAKEYKGHIISYDKLWKIYKKPDKEIFLTIKNDKMTPDVVEVRFNDLVEITIDVLDNKTYHIEIMGYGKEGIFPEASRGHPAILRLRADRPGVGFAFINSDTHKTYGFFKVIGAHFQEEMKKR